MIEKEIKDKSSNMRGKKDYLMIRINERLKEDARETCKEIGINLSDVIRVMLKKIVKNKKVPFDF